MIIQISSGQGPAECELAVGKFYDVLKKEYPDIKEITSHMSRFSGCYTSIMFETGVRLIHIPTGITVTSTSERSQILNKKDALEKLSVLLKEKQSQQKQLQANAAWIEHNRIIRGNPVLVYKGTGFKLA